MSYVAPKIMGWQFNFRQMLAKAGDGVTYQLVDIKGVLHYKGFGLDSPKKMGNTGHQKFDELIVKAYGDWLFEKDVLS